MKCLMILSGVSTGVFKYLKGERCLAGVQSLAIVMTSSGQALVGGYGCSTAIGGRAGRTTLVRKGVSVRR